MTTPPRRTPQRGKWVILLLMGAILSFTVWKQFFTEREHSSQAEAAIEPLTAPLKPIQMPAEQEPLSPPVPLAPKPKPQAQSPRPQARLASATAAEKRVAEGTRKEAACGCLGTTSE